MQSTWVLTSGHGTLHANVLEVDSLRDPTRGTSGAPNIFKKFIQGIEETMWYKIP
jgi:phospholipase D1/2